MIGPDELPRPLEAKAGEPYRIWLRYSDGTEGEVDLSHLAGHGVFAAWETPGRFGEACVSAWSALSWGDEIELCPDALYLQLTGLSAEQYIGASEDALADA